MYVCTTKYTNCTAPYGFDYLGWSKTQWVLQGPRLKAWTTKSSIRGNNWAPLGCRALLGSVNYYDTSGQLVFVCFLEDFEDTKKTF